MEEFNPDVTSGQSTPETITGDTIVETQPGLATQVAPVKKITRIKVLTAIFNGLGIGLLLGMLISLSLSPVVSGVIATLTGLLALLLGLDEKYIDSLKSIRVGTFGLAAVAGIMIGLYIRASNPFAPNLRDKYNDYISIEYTPEEARAFITKSVLSDSTKAKREAGVLYSSTVDAGACDDLQYASTDQAYDEIVNTFNSAGGTWKELAKALSGSEIPVEYKGISLINLRDVFCNLSSDNGKIKLGKLSKTISSDDDLAQIESVLSSSGDSWKAIGDKFKDIPENYRKDIYLLIVKVLTNK